MLLRGAFLWSPCAPMPFLVVEKASSPANLLRFTESCCYGSPRVDLPLRCPSQPSMRPKLEQMIFKSLRRPKISERVLPAWVHVYGATASQMSCFLLGVNLSLVNLLMSRQCCSQWRHFYENTILHGPFQSSMTFVAEQISGSESFDHKRWC